MERAIVEKKGNDSMERAIVEKESIMTQWREQ
jgi:hypothetical protein